MSPDEYAALIERLDLAVTVLIAAVLIAIAYILTQPVAEWRPKAEPLCPIHRGPASRCRDKHGD